MEKTQKLLGIALAVLALDGWGAASAAPEHGAPTPSPSPRADTHAGHSARSWSSHFWHIHSAHSHAGAAAAAAGAAALSRNNAGKGTDRTLGGRRGGGFGKSGAHGGGG
ncbi:MAG TPA: hypothetical protein VFF00_01015 [Candidatus Elarobacter sp.]|nr:hypothetical protein [Candidatus Elarobacter sp.]